MGKRLIRFLLAAVLCIMTAVPAFAALSGSETASVEQVLLNMPDVRVYGHGLSEAGTDIKAKIGNSDLKVISNIPFAETGEGVDYYVLLDVSNSIPDSYFKDIKNSILAFGQELGPNDRAELITFGESVNEMGDLTAAETEVRAMLDGIRNADNRTMLFEGISDAVQLADSRARELTSRKILLVFSDGEDVAEGKKVAGEALKELNEKSIPVYAFAIRDTARENINSFGEFARNSGGEIAVVQKNACGEALSEIREHIMSADCLTLTADSNKVSNSFEQFTLQLPGAANPLIREVFSYHYQPDTEAPVIVNAEQVEGRTLRVVFSEPVSGCSDPSNYVLKSTERTIPVGAVAEEGSCTMLLTAAESFPAGDYSLGCVNITDDTQDKNPVANTVMMALEKSDKDSAVVVQNNFFGGKNAGIAALALLIALAAFVIAIVAASKKKKAAGSAANGKESDDTIYRSDGEIKRHVHIEQAAKKKVTLIVSTDNHRPTKIETEFDNSMIVGRAKISDLYFDDIRMSKQHFCLEWDGSSMYIMDLHSTNGTSVNGVKINGRRRLEQGDRITAGSEDIVIRW